MKITKYYIMNIQCVCNSLPQPIQHRFVKLEKISTHIKHIQIHIDKYQAGLPAVEQKLS